MAGVPYVFASATTSIPLSQLDADFNTPVTIGNTSVGLGNTVTSFGNVTLVNPTLTSANVSISGGTANGVVYINSSNVAVASPTVLAFDGSNLGLGVTPSAWSGWGGPVIQMSSGANGAITAYQMYSTSNAYYSSNWKYVQNGYATYYQQAVGYHAWFIAPNNTTGAGATATFTQAMTLDNNGNLLVGTTSDVAGFKTVIAWSTASGSNGLFLNDTSNSSGTAFLYFSENGTTVGTVSRVGSTNAVVYGTTSDYRLKNVVGAVTGQGERIDALKPIDYTWKDGGQPARGFLAHEFQAVYADSVIGEKDAVDANGNPVYQGMQASTSEVIADLVAEIQSLRARLKAANIA